MIILENCFYGIIILLLCYIINQTKQSEYVIRQFKGLSTSVNYYPNVYSSMNFVGKREHQMTLVHSNNTVFIAAGVYGSTLFNDFWGIRSIMSTNTSEVIFESRCFVLNSGSALSSFFSPANVYSSGNYFGAKIILWMDGFWWGSVASWWKGFF